MLNSPSIRDISRFPFAKFPKHTSWWLLVITLATQLRSAGLKNSIGSRYSESRMNAPRRGNLARTWNGLMKKQWMNLTQWVVWFPCWRIRNWQERTVDRLDRQVQIHRERAWLDLYISCKEGIFPFQEPLCSKQTSRQIGKQASNQTIKYAKAIEMMRMKFRWLFFQFPLEYSTDWVLQYLHSCPDVLGRNNHFNLFHFTLTDSLCTKSAPRNRPKGVAGCLWSLRNGMQTGANQA
jgi:hypothetical protein